MRTLSPWRTVVGFGLVSLTADLVYEGARSVYGPLLASLGASALVVGLVTGAGEGVALVLRLVSGPLADRSGRYWTLTVLGYALTAVCVPLLAVTPALGAAGLAVAAVLIVAERLGKAIRSPAKSALLADAAGQVGMGRGMGVHKALDQVGAFAGPLLVAAVVALAAGTLWPALAVLALPGAVSLVVLARLRAATAAHPRRSWSYRGDVPEMEGNESKIGEERPGLPAGFWWFAAAAGLCTGGLVTYGLIGFHLTRAGVVDLAAVPLLYAAAMGVAAVAALGTGVLYDRAGPWTLTILPVLVTGVVVLVFRADLAAVVAGVLLWGAAVGVQDSTVKAMVADLVPRDRRATAYGLFAAGQGAAALVGGVAAGALYEESRGALVAVVAVSQVVALLILLMRAAPTGRRSRGSPRSGTPPSR